MAGSGIGKEPTIAVYQAQGMVAEQANCSMLEAMAKMLSAADATDETLEFVAAGVVSGSVRLE